MTSTGTADDANALAGDFGEAWLETVAAGASMLHGRPTTLDFDKADIEIVLREQVGSTFNPRVLAQVKTTITPLRDGGDSTRAYDLDATTYNYLCRTDHSGRRVLVVFEIGDPQNRVRLHDEGTLLLGKGLWMSLEGLPPTTNTATQTVYLPEGNTVDPAGLRDMLTRFGVRSTTPVPDVDQWGS